jgi:hypothetical protein
MASATNQIARTQGVSWASGLWTDGATAHLPQEPVVTSPFLTEHITVQPLSGSAQPGGTATFELPYDVDIIKGLNLQIVVDKRDALPGGTTNARLVDWFGLNVIDQIQIQFGTERLRTVRPNEMFEKVHFHYQDETRKNLQTLYSGAVSAASREQRLEVAPQRFVIPLISFLGVHCLGDPGQSLFVRGLAERIRLAITFAAANQLCEVEPAAAPGFTFTTAGVQGNPPPAAGWFLECSLYCEGRHIFDAERMDMENLYRQPRRYFFREAQVSNPMFFAAAATPGTIATTTIREFTQPTVALYLLIRAEDDLLRICSNGVALSSFGRNNYNFSPWFAPGGVQNCPLIKTAEITAGSNMWLLKPTDITNLLTYEHQRCYKGSGVESTAPAIPHISFSMDPTMENAQLGFVDPAQMDNIVLRLTLNSQFFFISAPPGLVLTSAATVGDVMTGVIGSASRLQIDVVADTFNELNFGKAMVGRSHN